MDSTKQLTFEQIRQLPDSMFIQNQKDFINFGNCEQPVWLRLDIDNQTQEDLYLIQECHEARWVDTYLITLNDSIKTWQVGTMRPIDNYFFKRNVMTFDLGKTPRRLYMRIQNPSLYIPIKMGEIRSLVAFFYMYDLVDFSMLGILLALIIYNLSLFVILKDKLFLYYFLYIVCSTYILVRSLGLHHLFIWHKITDYIHDINLTSVIMLFFMLLFANEFLRIKQLAPRCFWSLWG